MSVTDIVRELDRLTATERREVFDRLCELTENDLVEGAAPSSEEMRLLDRESAEFEKDRNAGRPWPEVLGDLRSEKRS
jgi:hypothetical protein